MKRNSLTPLFTAAVLLLVAGVQTARAQKVVLHMAGNQTFECSISQLDSITFEEEHEWVDLGLPSGTLWATCDVGANSPEEYGDYFAWGETKPKENYNWSTYKYSKGSYNTMTKYCPQSNYGYNGFTDNLTELLPEDDAATANWGSGWQMPSLAQYEELINSCNTTTEWTQQNDANGCKITGKNGNSIFLPAAGLRFDTTLDGTGSYGNYWSRSLDTSYASNVCDLHFTSRYVSYKGYDYRYYGQNVRPVRVKTR